MAYHQPLSVLIKSILEELDIVDHFDLDAACNSFLASFLQ
jgi:hypothetical protein